MNLSPNAPRYCVHKLSIFFLRWAFRPTGAAGETPAAVRSVERAEGVVASAQSVVDGGRQQGPASPGRGGRPRRDGGQGTAWAQADAAAQGNCFNAGLRKYS